MRFRYAWSTNQLSEKAEAASLPTSTSLRPVFVAWERLTRLPAGTSFQPIQIQHLGIGVPQPCGNFSRLKRPVSRTQVAIEKIRNFFSRARLPDSIQCSKDVLVEVAVRIWSIGRFRLSGLKSDLLAGTHSVFDPDHKYKPQITTDRSIRA
jgi:hypothetical protein